MQNYIDAMRRYFDFSGRARRSEYWMFFLVVFVLSLVAIFIDTAVLGGGGILYAIVAIAHLIPNLSVAVRRLHDVDKSGWWLLISVIPLIGAILLIVWACTDGTPGSNRFGPNPKGLGGVAAAV